MSKTVIVMGDGGPSPLVVVTGNDGPSPLACAGGGPKFLQAERGVHAYTQIEWETKIKRFAHLAVLELYLFTEMYVHIFGDTGMVLSQGASAQVWSGLNIDPATGVEWRFITRSMRFPKFTTAQQWLPVSTTYGTLLPAGPHRIYWNIAVFGGTELTTDPGSLMVQAFYPAGVGQLQTAGEAPRQFLDVENADESGKLKRS